MSHVASYNLCSKFLHSEISSSKRGNWVQKKTSNANNTKNATHSGFRPKCIFLNDNPDRDLH